jgi:hypothetical protein
MHAINSGFTVTKIKTMSQITDMCNQCMESVIGVCKPIELLNLSELYLTTLKLEGRTLNRSQKIQEYC